MKADYVITAQELAKMRDSYHVESVEPTLHKAFFLAKSAARNGKSSVCISLDGHTFGEIKTIEQFLQKQGLTVELESHCEMKISW